VFWFESFRWEAFPPSDREGTFLPIIAPDPPYRNYTVQSPSHLLDLVNAFALVAAPAVFVLLALLAFSRKKVNWGSVRVKFGVFAFLFMAGFYVMVHPLLTMPRDWDLFGLLALPVLFLTAILAAEGEYEAAERRRWSVLAVLSGLLLTPIFAVNASTPMLSKRLADLGEYAYGTSYKGSAVLIQMGQRLEPDIEKRAARRAATLERLTPWNGVRDPEYGFLMAGGGDLHALVRDTTGAERYWRGSLQYDPQLTRPRFNLARLYLLTGRPDLAAEQVDYLIEKNPADITALKRGLQVALAMRDLPVFNTRLQDLKRLAPGDPEIERFERIADEVW
jgi:hypothetical protein